MNEDSIKLLKEINSGCKNATDSFGRVLEFAKNPQLKTLIEDYNVEHVKIGDECHQMLNDHGKDEKDPSTMAKAMMWFTTEVKMMVDDDDSHIADLLANGCHMGIKSVSRYLNQYKKAGQDEVSLAGKLIRLEMELYKKLMTFI